MGGQGRTASGINEQDLVANHFLTTITLEQDEIGIDKGRNLMKKEHLTA